MKAKPRGVRDCCCTTTADQIRYILERIGSMVRSIKINATEYHPDGDGRVQIAMKTVGGESILGNGDIPVGGVTEWGDITGTLADQTDLADEFDKYIPKRTTAHSYPTVYGQAADGSEVYYSLRNNATAEGTIPQYDANGQLRTASPVSNSAAANKGYVDDGLALKADASSLATVATTGDYDDLTDKPDLSQFLTSVNWGDIGGTLADQSDLMTEILKHATIEYTGATNVTLAPGASTTLGYHNITAEAGYTYIAIGFSADFQVSRNMYYGYPGVGSATGIWITVKNTSNASKTSYCGEIQLKFKNLSGGSAIFYGLVSNTGAVFETFLSKYQNSADAGKLLMIGNDGTVAPAAYEGSERQKAISILGAIKGTYWNDGGSLSHGRLSIPTDSGQDELAIEYGASASDTFTIYGESWTISGI